MWIWLDTSAILPKEIKTKSNITTTDKNQYLRQFRLVISGAIWGCERPMTILQMDSMA
jgi:hypothetical protein